MFTYVRIMPCLPVIYYLSNINFLDKFDTAVNTYNYFLVHYLPFHNHKLKTFSFSPANAQENLKFFFINLDVMIDYDLLVA